MIELDGNVYKFKWTYKNVDLWFLVKNGGNMGFTYLLTSTKLLPLDWIFAFLPVPFIHLPPDYQTEVLGVYPLHKTEK